MRELRNFVERAVSLGLPSTGSGRGGPPVAGGARASGASGAAGAGSSEGATIADLVPWHLPLKDARQVWTEQFELVYTRAVLEKAGGNVTHAAEQAGSVAASCSECSRASASAADVNEPQTGDDDGG
ncbi:MAG: hypothetical protein R3B70_11995 [Polyangiaceae bacterium]